MKERSRWEELVLAFVMGQLNQADRAEVYQLIAAEPEFARMLTVEMRVKSAFKTFSPNLAPDVQQRILAIVTDQTAEKAGLRFVHSLCKAVLPPIAQPLVYLMEKGVLVNV